MAKVEELESQDDLADSGHATEEEEEEEEGKYVDEAEDDAPVKLEMVWRNVAKFIILHSLALWGVTLLPSITQTSWLFLFMTYQVNETLRFSCLHELDVLPLLVWNN